MIVTNLQPPDFSNLVGIFCYKGEPLCKKSLCCFYLCLHPRCLHRELHRTQAPHHAPTPHLKHTAVIRIWRQIGNRTKYNYVGTIIIHWWMYKVPQTHVHTTARWPFHQPPQPARDIHSPVGPLYQKLILPQRYRWTQMVQNAGQKDEVVVITS